MTRGLETPTINDQPPATQTTRSSRDLVFGTAELFEAILTELPFFDLVVASGVNHRFRDFVTGSRKLQQQLFLLPVPDPARCDQQKGPAQERQGALSPYNSDDSDANELNSLDFHEFGDVCPILDLLTDNLYIGRNYKSVRTLLQQRLGKTGSWRRMYLTRPPLKLVSFDEVYVVDRTDGSTVTYKTSHLAEHDEGVKFSHIDEEAHKHASVYVSVDEEWFDIEIWVDCIEPGTTIRERIMAERSENAEIRGKLQFLWNAAHCMELSPVGEVLTLKN